MMDRRIYGALAVMTLVALPLASAEGQRGARRGQRGPRPGGVEQLLRQREQLELTDQQVTQLNELRLDGVEAQKRQAAEMVELRSLIQSGETAPDGWREQMAERRQAMQAAGEQRRERGDAILTDEQRARINTLRQERQGPRRDIRGGRMGGRRPAMSNRSGRRFSRGRSFRRRGSGQAWSRRGRGFNRGRSR